MLVTTVRIGRCSKRYLYAQTKSIPKKKSHTVDHPFTFPYNLSSSSILHFLGYCTTQVSQSRSQSTPSTLGSVVGNKDVSSGALRNPWVPRGAASGPLAGPVKKDLPRWRRDEIVDDIFPLRREEGVAEKFTRIRRITQHSQGGLHAT